MPKLIYKDPDTGSQVVVEINNEMSEVTVGRNPGNIIRINNPSVSRRHTKFVYENQQVTLHDLNSSNGTYVNGMRIQQQVLEDGDLVRVGEFPLDFVDDVEPADTKVEDGQLAEAAQDSSMKSTHMGMGAMGMGGDSGPGGAMASGGEVTEAHEEPPDTGSTSGPATSGGEPQEFILGEDDIEEVVESEDVHARIDDDGFGDDTVEASADDIQAIQAGAEGSVNRDEDAQTKRADGDALAMQFEQSLEGEISGDDVDNAEVEQLRQTVAELRAELEKAPSPEVIEEVTEERDEALRRADQLEDEIADQQQRLDGAQGDLIERDERIEELEATVGELRNELASTNDQLEALKSDNEQLEQQLDDRQQAIEELESRLSKLDAGGGDEALRDELRQKEQQLEELHREVASFDEERQKKKEIFKELSGDLRELVAAKGELQEQLEAARSERDELMTQLDELEGSDGEAVADPIGGQQSDDYQSLLEEKEALEETLAEVILERDRLEDELQGLRDAG